MLEHTDSAVLEDAKAWIDSVNGNRETPSMWRLQLMSKKWRLNMKTLERKELPLRIRRFVEGLPPGGVTKAAIEYLLSLAPYEHVIFNGEELYGKYRPTHTWWERDDQDVVNGQQKTDGTYTLFQDLVPWDDEDWEGATTESSCSEETVTEWHWDDAEVGELPEGSQGVVYSISASYNKEDGTFDWQLVKRTAKTQHMEPVVTQCNDLAKTVTETWDNLYGPEDGWYLDELGNKVFTIPDCNSTPGKMVQVTITENPNCTYKASVTTSETNPDEYEWIDGTLCHTKTTVVQSNVRLPKDGCSTAQQYLAKHAPVKAGRVVSSSAKHNPDLTWDFTWQITESPEPVGDPASKTTPETWEDGTDCRSRLVKQYRNIPTWEEAQMAIPKLSTLESGKVLGVSVQRNETDCTYDVAVTESDPPAEWIDKWKDGSECRKEVTYVFQSVPEKPDLSQFDSAVLGPGYRVDISISKKDDCTWDARVVVIETVPSFDEGTDPWTNETWTEGSACSSVSYYNYRNLRSLNDAKAAIDAHPISAGVTRSVRFSKDENTCTYDVLVGITETPQDPVYQYVQGSKCRRSTTTVYKGLTSLADAQSKIPSVDEVDGTLNVSLRKNADCSWDLEYTITTPEAYDSVSWTDGSECKKIENYVVSGIPTKDEALQLLDTYGKVGKGYTVDSRISKDQDCTWTVTIVKHYASADGDATWTDGTCMTQQTTTVETAAETPDLNVTPAEGQSVQARVYMNDDCTWTKQVTVSTPKAWKDTQSWYSGDRSHVTQTTYRNQVAPIIRTSRDPDVSVSNRWTLNEYCLYDGDSTITRTLTGSSSSASRDYIFGPYWVGTPRCISSPLKWNDTDQTVEDMPPATGSTRPGGLPYVMECGIVGSLKYKDLADWLADSHKFSIQGFSICGSYGRYSSVFHCTARWSVLKYSLKYPEALNGVNG